MKRYRRQSPFAKNASYLAPYHWTSLCYLAAMLILKAADILCSPCASVGVLLRGLLFSCWHALWTALLLLPLYLLLNIRWKRFAFYTSASLFALLTVAEVGFTVYTHHNGTLLGSELLARPLRESLDAVVGATGILLPIIGILLIISLFLIASHQLLKVRLSPWLILLLPVIMLACWPLRPHINKLYASSASIPYIAPKVRHFLTDCAEYRRYLQMDKTMQEVKYDEAIVKEYLALHPDWQVADPRYPLQRTDSTPDVLAPYFSADSTAPDIIMILVESLGEEFLGTGTTPFLDSLSRVSLYWENCLSTTMRSFGAIPAITGSVQGPRGFQFGTMPDHNSLLSILHRHGYRTQAFYGGYFTFDCIYEYLTAQRIDYLSPFYEELKANESDTLGNWWGYHDHVMLRRTAEELEAQTGQTPSFSLVTTLTSHEGINLGNSQRDKYYNDLISQVAAQQPDATGKIMRDNIGRYAAMRYTDDCLRNFIQRCQRLPRYRNTIFVITGDHASGIAMQDKLAFHHVPLLIWSPQLTRPKQFPSLVTHLDIAPTLAALLRDHYHLAMPATTHWLGEALDTNQSTHLDRTLLIVDYDRGLRTMVQGDLFYQSPTQWEGETAYRIGNDLSLTALPTDESLLQQLRRRLEVEKNLLSYTYYANALTNAPVYPHHNATLIKSVKLGDEILYRVPNRPPSEVGKETTDLMKSAVIANQTGSSRIRVTLTADIVIVDSLWQDEYPNLTFRCKNSTDTRASDKIVKFINAETLHPGSTHRLSISKEFVSDTTAPSSISIYLTSPQYDHEWKPGTELIIKNGNVVIEEIQ